LQVSNRIYTLSLELYDPTSANLARYAFEVLLAGCIVLLNIIELARFMQAARWSWRGRLDKGLRQHLSSIGVWLRLVNNVLLLTGLGLWWTFVNQHAKQFSMDLRYPVSLSCCCIRSAGLIAAAPARYCTLQTGVRCLVSAGCCTHPTHKSATAEAAPAAHNRVYLPTAHHCALPAAMMCRPAVVRSAACFMQVYVNLQPQAFFLKLANNGAGLASAWEAITRLEAAISVLNVYYAINGICILLLIARSVVWLV
jgi:hypothetical protein